MATDDEIREALRQANVRIGENHPLTTRLRLCLTERQLGHKIDELRIPDVKASTAEVAMPPIISRPQLSPWRP